jgi:heme-degrading monooxygenase HmoA
VLVVNRFVVPDEEQARTAFTERAGIALAALAGCRGYRSGQLGRGYDDPAEWRLVTEWESVGAYRRALSSFEVKVHATPLLAESRDEASAFEVLLTAGPGGALAGAGSDRAAEPPDAYDRGHERVAGG